MKKLVLLLLISMPIVSSGQRYERVSGYMGKRLTLGLGVDFSPSTQPQKPFDGHSHHPNDLNMNYMFIGQLQYVTGSYFSLVTRFGYNRTSALLKESIYTTWDGEGSIREYRLNHIYSTPQINEFFYGVNLRWYLKRKGALAPLGFYLALGGQMHHFSFDYSPIELNIEVNPFAGSDYNEIQTFDQPRGSAIYPEIYAEFGSAMLLGQSLVIEVSGKPGFLFTSGNNVSEEGETVIGQEIADEVRIRLRNHYFFNLGLRISYLL